MKILLTNDDGVEARGLQALWEAAQGLGELLIVAPLHPVSGCSHCATTEKPIRVEKFSENRYGVDGTPADCVRIALHRFDGEIGGVLSGINSGGNLGVDVYHSGTVAAVREAALRGVPGIAVSHYRNRMLNEQDWQRAAHWTRPLLQDLVNRTMATGVFWNINLPSLEPGVEDTEIVFCPLEPSPLPLSFHEDRDLLHYNGKYASRPRRRGSDVDVCFGGKIAVSEVTVMEPSR